MSVKRAHWGKVRCVTYIQCLFNIVFIEINGLQKAHLFNYVAGYLIWMLCNELECMTRAGMMQCLWGYTSKCGYEPVLRSSNHFDFPNVCLVSGVLSNWAPELTEQQKTNYIWHFRRDEAKQSRRQIKRPRPALLDLFQKTLPGIWQDATPHGLNLPQKYGNCIGPALLLTEKDSPLL